MTALDALREVRTTLLGCNKAGCDNPAEYHGFEYDLPELCEEHKNPGDRNKHHFAELACRVHEAIKQEENTCRSK